MSDRVSRLAELRKKRDQKVLESLDDVKPVIVEKKVGHEQDKDVDKTDEEVFQKQENVVASLPNEDTVLVATESISQSFEVKSPVDTSASIDDKPNEELTYNSDLKRDISDLLNRAQAGTERAMNEILWKRYLESQAD